jgi:hypothetical protein
MLTCISKVSMGGFGVCCKRFALWSMGCMDGDCELGMCIPANLSDTPEDLENQMWLRIKAVRLAQEDEDRLTALD